MTIRWIFLVPQDIGLIAQVLCWEISFWVAKVIIPAWDSGLLLDAWESYESNIFCGNWLNYDTYVTVFLGIVKDFICCEQSWNCGFIGSWLQVAIGNLKDQGVCVRRRIEESQPGLSACVVLVRWPPLTYFAWESCMPLSGNCCLFLWTWRIWISLNRLDILLPVSSFWICGWTSHPWIPSSTWTPRAPDSFPVSGFMSMSRHGSNGLGLNPSCSSSSHRVWNQRYGVSIKPDADLSSLQISDAWSFSHGFCKFGDWL